MDDAVKILPFGEAAAVVEFGDRIDPEIHRRAKAFADYLEANPFPGLVEYILAYTNVTVFYKPCILYGMARPEMKANAAAPRSYQVAAEILQGLLARSAAAAPPPPRVVEVPVCYEGEFAPDLDFVAAHNRLTPKEVVDIHTGGEYLVYMIGFAPGFPFLGGMSKRLETPRRQSPRLSIPAGSVGIAGMQTGVYPLETPGGWRLIGRTPLALFRPGEDPPSFLRAGDVVRFRRISAAAYKAYKEVGGCG